MRILLHNSPFFASQEWPTNAQQFPFTIAVPGILFALYIVYMDMRHLAASRREFGSIDAAWAQTAGDVAVRSTIIFFVYLIGMLLLTMLVGQKIAIPIYIATYLIRWGKYSWRAALTYAAGGWLVLVAFYDRVMNLFWYPTLFADWLEDLLPDWFPDWLII